MKKETIIKKTSYYFLSVILISCINELSFSEPTIICVEPELETTHSIAQVKKMAGFGIVTFSEEIIIKGYVVSSDVSGNIYKVLFIQDSFENPNSAIRFSIDKTNLYASYPLGRKIYVKLKGLSIGYNRGALEIGKADGVEMQRISVDEVKNHFFRGCGSQEISPKKVTLNDIDDAMVNMLLEIENLQFKEEDIGEVYAELNSTNSVDRYLEQISENCELLSEIALRISGFSSFKSKELPKGKGSVVGVLTKYYSKSQLLLSTEEDVNFTEERCVISKTLEPTISYNKIIELYESDLFEFGVDEPYIFEGYVISSDEQGNFINRLIIQENYENSSGGFQLLIDKENYFESYEVGDKVLLKLNKLYMSQIDGVFTIGFPKEDGIQEIENPENYIVNTHEKTSVIPKTLKLSEISLGKNQNTLVTLENVQLKENELGKAFTYYTGENSGYRILKTCDVLQEIFLETLGSATFSNEKFPVTNGNISGILYREDLQLKFQIRTLDDIDMPSEYKTCAIVIPKILITEVADPQNDMSVRFVELYNAGEYPILMNRWKLKKYLNGSHESSGSGIDLSGFVIEPNDFLVISNIGFEIVFGITPKIISTSLSGNGDDVYELVDENGKTHDIYGEIGIDGTGSSWEYLDGKAVRKISVTEPNEKFDADEWDVFSKTSGLEQLAPENFSPLVR